MAKKNTGNYNLKSRIFAGSVILCIVLSITLYFVVKSYRSYRVKTQSESEYEQVQTQFAEGTAVLENGKLFTEAGGAKFELTLDPVLQETAEQLMEKYDPVVATFIAIDEKTGAVQVMASHSRKHSHLPMYERYQTFKDPVLRAGIHPMASIAKLITASAALELEKAQPGDVFHCNGKYVVEGQGTVNDHGSHGDINMGRALATSCNPIYARLGVKVGRDGMMQYFDKYLFNKPLEFDIPVMESTANIGSEEYRLARAGSGFEGAWLSPLHAAMIAATLANDGHMMQPFIVKSVSKDGSIIYEMKPEEIATPVDKRTANIIMNMMSGTVNSPGGTAYKGFYNNGKPLAPGIDIVGKTGSINGMSELDHYLWFVGHAKKGNRSMAFAAMVVNDNNWRIKAASYTGQFMLAIQKHFE